jgi:hypothetical protein
MDSTNQTRTFPRGTPQDSMNWSEPAYTSNKCNDRICGLKRVCSNRCQICPMLDIEAYVIRSSVNGRKFSILTNEDIT